MKQTQKIIIYTDGGSRGNPGPSAAAFILEDERRNQIEAKGLFLGQGTNNFAEYTAVIKALEAAKQRNARRIELFCDSELVVKQINGQYKVKSENLKALYSRCLELLNFFESWKITYIKREQNCSADKLVNLALDKRADVEKTKLNTTKKASATSQIESIRNLKRSAKPLRLGVLISGGGTTMLNILSEINNGRLNAEIALVISSRSTVAGVERARNAGLDVKIIRKKDYPDIDEFSSRIEEELVAANVDLVIQGGWLCLWKIPLRYEKRVMNIHPALLPSFGGKGMWGHHVHEAVLKAGCKISGCTVHFCTNEYDKGPIIVQRCCEVKDDDTPDSLAERVFQQECIAYPQAIKIFEQQRLIVKD